MTIAASSAVRTLSPGVARQVVVEVEFESRGSRRSTVGGGDTLADALAFARDSLPGDRHWRVVRVRDLYGD